MLKRVWWLWAGALVMAGALPAVEPPSAAEAVRTELKTVYGAARTAGDLWTVLQCEAYAATRLNQHLGPALAGCEVAGDPLFAFPDVVEGVVDRGERVVVQTPHSCHLLAADGRPLAASIRSEGVITAVAGDADNRFVAMLITGETEGVLSLRRWPEGGERWRCSVDADTDAQLRLLAVSADGQAVLTLQDEKLRLVIAGKSRVIAGRWQSAPAVVAPQGRWFLAHRKRNGEPAERFLVRGETLLPVRAFAEIPEGGAVLALAPAQAQALGVTGSQGEGEDDTVAVRLDAQGNATPVPVTIRLGRSPAVMQEDGMVLFGSEAHMSGVTTVDLLGEPVTTAPQPPRVEAFRCQDLLAAKEGAIPSPCYAATGRVRRCSHRFGAWYVWSGRDITQIGTVRGADGRLDLQSRAWPQQEHPVQYMHGRRGRVLVQTDDGMQTVCDDQGTVLARHRGDISVETSAWGLASNGLDGAARRWTLFGFLPPTRTVELMGLAGCQQVDVDALERFVIGRKAGEPVYAGLPSGTPMEVPMGHYLMSERDFAGRFSGVEGRIRGKTTSWEEGRGQWVIADAMPVGIGGAMAVLDRAGQVWLPAPPSLRRGGDLWRKAGSDLHYLQLIKGERGLVLTDHHLSIIGRIDPRQVPLVVQPAPGVVQAEDPDELLRLRQTQRQCSFRLASGQRLAWLPARTGFLPRRLHLTAQGGLIVVTPSLMLGLPASALPLVAGPDTRER